MLYPKVVILLLAIEGCSATSVFNLDFWHKTHEVAYTDLVVTQKACEIAKQYDSYIYIVYTSNVRQDDSIFRLEFNLLKCMSELPTHIIDVEQLTKERERKYNSFSIFVLPTSAAAASLYLQRIIGLLNEKQTRKHFHKYTFIWRDAQIAQLGELFEAIWQRKILNAIVITDVQHIYTFEPFTPAGFALKRITNGQYFYDKLKNLHHHQLRITMFTDFLRAIPKRNRENGYDGVDGLLASSIVSYLNATANYTQPADNENYGDCLPNGSFSGVLKHLIAGDADVGFNARFTLPCMEGRIEKLYPYFKRKLYLIVPAAKMQPEYLIFITAFNYALWRLLSLNFVVVTVTFALLNHWTERLPHAAPMKHAHWYELVEMFVKTQLGEPVAGFSRISSLREFLMAWILFSYVLTTIYFAKLESSFVQPVYEDQMDSLDDLDKLDVTIFGVHTLFTTVQQALKPAHWRAIEKRAVSLPLHFSSFQYALPLSMRKNGHVAFVLRGEAAKDFVLKSYDIERRRPRFHVVKEYLRSMPQTYILERGSPFRYKFQLYQSSIFESGLMECWSNKNLHYSSQSESQEMEEIYVELPDDSEFDLNNSAESGGGNANRTRKRVVLSLTILQGAFYLWCFGILLSVVGFVLEYVYWLRGKKKRFNVE
ncbi:uncharacterized protein LOC129242890 [Anastrepha obliqua]|uniref:uncharacterized protein LOC129242890 n=1 Tax=Anastrepha obliqua TaxID=95512 RepID=UPI0024094C1D|nr:uncharacterized protein LOC129242890 [Anastrepha obliqua]